MEILLSGGGHASGGVVENELLNEFFRGYPLQKLLILLRSPEENAFEAGAWIASELGRAVTSLVNDLSPFLEHPSPYVRYFIMDAILVGATTMQGEALAKAVLAIRDQDVRVRQRALYFLAHATNDQLTASGTYVHDVMITILLTWLLNAEDTHAFEQSVIERLHDEDSLVRLFAVAAAARHDWIDRALLEKAASSPDTDVSAFAERELKS